MKFSALIFANLFRKKIRLILTIGSFAVAMFLFAFLAVVKDAFNRGADVAGADRLVVIDRVSIINLIPLKYRDQILQIPGVKSITHNNWFGGVYQDEKNFFPQFVIDPENQRHVFPELAVPEDQWNAFLKDRQGAIAGAKTAERFHWKIGDRIPIKTTLYGGGSWEFNLDGIYHGERPEMDETQFWLQWDYFEEKVPEAVKGQIGWYVLRVNNPEDSVRVAKTIDDKFANSSSETKTETESAFAAGWVKQFGNIQFLIVTIGTVVFFTLLLVTATRWPFPFVSARRSSPSSRPSVFPGVRCCSLCWRNRWPSPSSAGCSAWASRWWQFPRSPGRSTACCRSLCWSHRFFCWALLRR